MKSITGRTEKFSLLESTRNEKLKNLKLAVAASGTSHESKISKNKRRKEEKQKVHRELAWEPIVVPDYV